MNNTALIILAAGSSSRLNGIKQLLSFHHKTLLQHVIDEAVASGAKPVIVVTGANADEIVKSLKQQQAEIIYNENWKEGMASSIVAGLQQAIHLNHELEGVIFTVCDQPFVARNLFTQLYEMQQSNPTKVVACAYAGTIGTPVLFTKKYFDELMKLNGDEGAKKILRSNIADVVTIEFPGGTIDIDTPNDYENLLNPQ